MDIRRSERIKSIKKRKNMNQNSNTNKSCKVISKLLLPEDLMINIFTFVPLTCLINSARYVCKSWAATIRSSYFAEMYELRGHSKPGIYVENKMFKDSSYFLEFKDDVNCQFERTNLRIPERMGSVINTCDGILLLWNCHKEIFVVNPILKCWFRIPPLPSPIYMVSSNQLILTRVPRTTIFKLLYVKILDVSGALWYVWYALRIGIDNSWKEIARKEFCYDKHIYGQLIYSGGNDLYWILPKEVVVMNVDTEIIVQEYPLPYVYGNYMNLTYLWMENRLSCIAYYCVDHYIIRCHIYTLDLHSGKWSLYHKMIMLPFDYVVTRGHRLNSIMGVVFCLWINDRIIFRVILRPIDNILTNFKNIYFGYNIKTKQLTKIEDIAEGSFEVWLHTNSLVSFTST